MSILHFPPVCQCGFGAEVFQTVVVINTGQCPERVTILFGARRSGDWYHDLTARCAEDSNIGEWLQSLPVGWMALVVFSLTYLAAWAILTIVARLPTGARARNFKSVSAGMLPPLGIIFGLLVAFVASQVWNDMNTAQAAVNREASELSTVLFLATSFPGKPETRLRDLTRRHIQDAVTYE